MKIKKLSVSVVLCVLVYGLAVEPSGNSPPSTGPKPGETGKYVYSEDGVTYKHCLYCDPKIAFRSDKDNQYYQEPRCGDKYEKILDEITPFEKENKLYPVCKYGTIPGCGPPPEVHKTADDTWTCDPGFSNKNYSVYFSCTLVNKHSKTVVRSYYCNESLQWDDDLTFTVSPTNEITTGKVTDDGDYKTVFIIAGVFMVLVVIFLVVVIVCIIYNRNRRDIDSIDDSDSSNALMNVDYPQVTNYKQGSMTSASLDESVTGSGGPDSIKAEDKSESSGMTSVARLPPYGQEEPKTIGCQTTCSLFPQYIVSGWENKVHNSDVERLAGVRAELQHSLTSAHRDYQHPVVTNHIIENCKFVNDSNYQNETIGINNLNKGQENCPPRGTIRSKRPNPLGNISNSTCSDDGDDDNRHNTELKQIVNERQTECKQSNICSCPNNLQSQQNQGSTCTDHSLQPTSHRTCAHGYELQCTSSCLNQSSEVSNEMVNMQQGQSDNDSFEIYSYQIQKEFYA